MRTHTGVRRKAARSAGLGVLLLAAQLLAPAQTGRAAPAASATVTKDQASISFPNTITFQIQVQGESTIDRIVLEYGVEMLTCGEVVAKAFPDFKPAKSVSASWTWDMRQSGSEPPGARIWWRWRILDTGGQETVTEKKNTVWLDDIYPWKSQTKDLVTLHWYSRSQAYGQDLVDSAATSLEQINSMIGLTPDVPIDLYIYSDVEDMRDSVLYEAGWAGGISFGENADIILAIPNGYETWGKESISHELMHTVVKRYTFSCLFVLPFWLDEGLAMVSEGELDDYEKVRLDSAILNNTLFPLPSLTGAFPEDPELAILAYAQSQSVVDYLLHQGTSAQMREMLDGLHTGKTIDESLMSAFGFNVNELDNLWRKSVGANPLSEDVFSPTATPTYVPTLEPLSLNPEGSAALPKKTPSAGRTPAPSGESAGAAVQERTETVSGLPWGTIIPVFCIGMICLIVILIAVLLVAVKMAGRKS
jgi:hypothetical protein